MMYQLDNPSEESFDVDCDFLDDDEAIVKSPKKLRKKQNLKLKKVAKKKICFRRI